MKTLHRYQIQYFVKEVQGSDYGEFAVEAKLHEIKIIKETTCTYLIQPIYGAKLKRIYKRAVNTYAHENKQDALKCFYHRTLKHAGIMQNKAALLKELLKKIKLDL